MSFAFGSTQIEDHYAFRLELVKSFRQFPRERGNGRIYDKGSRPLAFGVRYTLKQEKKRRDKEHNDLLGCHDRGILPSNRYPVII